MKNLLARTSAIVTVMMTIALALPVSAATPPTLIDQTGHRFTFSALRGTPVVVTFVAAHCTEACPLVNAQFAQASQQFSREHTNVKLLTITLDPEHDPPAVMKDLAKRFSADPKYWLLAGGSVREVHRVMSAFGVVAQQGRNGYAEMHSTFVYFIDKNGNLRKTVLASTALASQIVELAQR